jgi:hypothetical protein
MGGIVETARGNSGELVGMVRGRCRHGRGGARPLPLPFRPDWEKFNVCPP